MRRLFIIFCSLFCLYTFSPLMAQYTQGKEDLIAPSPTVAAMVKFGQIPVSYHTGVPSISIPLYTLQCGDLTLPISLDYHAGGIRVNDVASWVGLGWSLNAGGVVNISMNGDHDNYLATIMSMEDVENNPYKYEDMKLYLNKAPDTQPDIYSYQVGNYSGQFIFDLNTFKAYNVKGSKDIIFSKKGYRDLSAIDEFGNQYRFDITENVMKTDHWYDYTFSTNTLVERWGANQNFAQYSNHLSKIVSANQTDSITISHKIMNETYNTQITGNICWAMNWERQDKWSEYVDPTGKLGAGNLKRYYNMTRECHTRKISSITTSNGIEVVFTTGSLRKDLNKINSYDNASTLEKIEIFDPNNKLIKKWVFEYDYFVSYILDPDDDAANYRLKLISLKEYGEDSSLPLIHTFNYYGESTGEPQMPYRNSFSGQDYWGFCNKMVIASDAKNFKKSFPNIDSVLFWKSYMKSTDIIEQQIQYVSYTEGEDKRPSPNYQHAYSLKKITYPTGGYTTFEYEPNSYNYSSWNPRIDHKNELGGGQRIKRITSYPITGYTVAKEYLYNSSTGNTTGEVINVPKPAKQRVWQTSPLNPVRNNELNPQSRPQFAQSYLELSSSSFSSLYSFSGYSFGYNTVTELDTKGKTIYNYFELIDYHDGFFYEYENILRLSPSEYIDEFDFQYGIIQDDGLRRLEDLSERTDDNYTDDEGYWGTFYKMGTLKSKSTYNNSNTLIYHESYDYTDRDQTKIYGLQVYTKPHIEYEGNPMAQGSSSYLYHVSPIIFYNTYCHLVGLYQLTQKTTTQYDENGQNPVTVKEEYTYNDNNLLAETKITGSNNEVIKTSTRYPSDINSGIYSTMKSKNMLNYPIEMTKNRNGKIVEAKINAYKLESNKVLPSSIHTLKAPSTTYPYSTYNGVSVPAAYTTEYTYNKYSAGGKVNSILGLDNTTSLFIWSHKGTYPIARIDNMTYADLVKYISESRLKQIEDRNIPLADDYTLINQLRTLVPTALVTTYTYKDLFGITSVTDPSGKISSYEYDSFGRLVRIRDHAMKVIEEYKYNYMNK